MSSPNCFLQFFMDPLQTVFFGTQLGWELAISQSLSWMFTWVTSPTS